ncbi:Myb-like DNA-binding domain containing protein [Trichomonas vaginalis G3]|uniref:Myb-like DNA-binding domain containing protein n=1 Tax=Trichomonas vaginalis (strain ATCC PRA-98 / G3) TaxID=412133 RepID=A2FW33_TRIV3|nr:RNA polymerase II transcription regulator recruiting protein [Trichomonas vaginalis G3]EAX90880.1 Myb-like DNA-binding domain containing protein [Trichomonas vaginalis G3]KAI5504707.1 RNA polymerase II transcription regulator recruiting protein [Trichomonas vaginalis G3]|eukprot:XP_001303810.1 Myb-like DNA-binding domain containing protein [Trichomonas vaginalis G3]
MNYSGLSRRSLGSIGKPHPKMQFSSKEDAQLVNYVTYYGQENWDLIAQLMGNRNVRQCRERYTKYLSPDINRDPWTKEEDQMILDKYKQMGPKWTKFSKIFNKRTDAAIKNRWNMLIRQIQTSGDICSSEPEEEKPTQKIEAVKTSFYDGKDFLFQGFEYFSKCLDIFEDNPFAVW